MAAIVLVHGIDQQQKSADRLEVEWLPDLAGGVRVAGFPELSDRLWRDRASLKGIEARMAFYGNLFLVPGQQGDDPGELSTDEELFADQLALEWLERAAHQASKPRTKAIASQELAYVRHEIGREEAGIGEVMRMAIRSVGRVPWFAPYGMAFAKRFVAKALAQVTRYLSNEDIRSAALKSVLDLIDTDTQVVIGHSLGSVVAFEAVHESKHSIPLLITLGSPLGLHTVIYHKLIPQPPKFPRRVQWWVNVADRDDFIAAEPDLTEMFSSGIPEDSIFEGGHTVDNGAEPHRGSFYLSKVQVGRPVGTVLSAHA